MSLADDMLAMIQEDVLPHVRPDEPNFEKVEEIGGTKNHLGELVPDSIDRTPFIAIETTGLGKLDDSMLNERAIGGQVQGEIVLMLEEDLLREGDRVERIEDGQPYKVVSVDAPRLNNQVVSYNAGIRKVTD